jgi:cupin 2 domain-containing protein
MSARWSGNLRADLPTSLPEERFDALIDANGLTLARIVSTGQVTPEGQWYDQPRDEWVLVLKGAARLSFDGDQEQHEMGPGDHVMIPAHVRHRVEWTSETEPTVWLVLHLPERDQT